MAKSCLEGDGRPNARLELPGVCRRDGHQHIAFSDIRLVQEGKEGLQLGASQSRKEHHRARQHKRGGDGSIALRGGRTRNANVFETYVERVLTPTLREGQVVIMDNRLKPTKESE